MDGRELAHGPQGCQLLTLEPSLGEVLKVDLDSRGPYIGRTRVGAWIARMSALTLEPLVLSFAQSWRMDRRDVSFNS